MFHGSNPIIGLNEFRSIVSEVSSNFWVTLYSVYIVCNVHCIIGRQPLSDPSGAYTGYWEAHRDPCMILFQGRIFEIYRGLEATIGSSPP